MNDDDLRRLFEETQRHFDEKAAETQRHFEVDRGFADTQGMIKFSHAELDRRVRALERALTELQARVDRLETTTH